MTWTPTTLNIKDAANATQPIIAYTDGTNFSFAHPLLDAAGNIIGSANPLPMVATAGTAKIGAVRQDCAVAAGSTTTRLANATPYALGQLISFSGTAATVNASPVAIAAARGTDLPSIARRCRLIKSGTGQTNPYFRVHFWNAAPTVVNGDAGAFSANLDGTYCGAFDVNCTRVGSGGSWGAGFASEGGDMAFTPVSGTSNLYYLLEARAAYTPGSGEVFTPYLELV